MNGEHLRQELAKGNIQREQTGKVFPIRCAEFWYPGGTPQRNVRIHKKLESFNAFIFLKKMARVTGLEPATSGVTDLTLISTMLQGDDFYNKTKRYPRNHVLNEKNGLLWGLKAE
ncbi:MAG: hypothetical protein R3C60_14305 [Parvularculaceae bacterium]